MYMQIQGFLNIYNIFNNLDRGESPTNHLILSDKSALTRKARQ